MLLRRSLSTILLWFAVSAISSAQTSIPRDVRFSVVVTKSIDAKAPAGAAVELVLSSPAKFEKVTFEKGSKLRGRITQAVMWDKKTPSRLAIIVEEIQSKATTYKMRAFMVGKLKARNSQLGAGPGAIYGVEVGSRGDLIGGLGSQDQTPVDRSCTLQLSENPDIVSEIVSKERNVALDRNSTFDIMTVDPS